ncbi:MAG: hypothetical protein IPI12_13195 [Ignavibacteriales bacterium]|nr:hypothetical protein [Ignavibacteriales bacterium]
MKCSDCHTVNGFSPSLFTLELHQKHGSHSQDHILLNLARVATIQEQSGNSRRIILSVQAVIKISMGKRFQLNLWEITTVQVAIMLKTG